MTRLGAIAAITAAVVAAGSARAGVSQPQTLDANTAESSYDVGAVVGGGQAWAAFVQPTNGLEHLYVAHAQGGLFGAAALVDGGSPISGAVAAGNSSGDGVIVYRQMAGIAPGSLYARRLTGGRIGDEAMLTAAGESGNLPQIQLGVHHRRVLAENDAGAAALCYTDPHTDVAYAAVSTAGDAWTRYGPLMSRTCDDIGVDARGDVIIIGEDAHLRAAADRIVDGALHSEEIDPDAMDEESLALAANGAVLVFARTTTGNDFSGSAWLLGDIAAGGSWKSLGAVDNGARSPGENTEYVRGALAPNGKGILTFRVNHPAAGTSSLYWSPVDTSAPAALGRAQKLADVDGGADAIPQVDARGDGLALYDANANETASPVVQTLGTGPHETIQLSTDAHGAFCVPCFQVDRNGSFLSLVRQGASPQRIAAVFDTVAAPAPPKPRLRAVPVTVRHPASVTLLGSSFRANTRVALFLVPFGSDVRRPFARARALPTGAFRYRLRFAKRTRPGRYRILACQAACAVKATATVRVR